MASTGINGTGVFIVLVGSVLAYSGLKGKKVGTTVKAFLAGEVPGGQPDTGLGIVTGSPGASDIPAQSGGLAGTGTAVSGGNNVIVAAALSQLGKPYVWDTPLDFHTVNPPSFDCSGLTGWCYAKIGKKLSHFTGAQFVELHHRSFSEVQPGDLVFFGPSGASSYHVGIWVGNGQVCEAPDVSIPVRVRAVHAGDRDLVPIVGYA